MRTFGQGGFGMRVRRRIAATLVVLLAVGLTGGPVGAQGDPDGFGPHSGKVGLHWILDNPGPQPELPAVQCIYGGSDHHLTRLRIRQPVLLANASGGYRRQVVAWRAVVEAADDPGGPWTFTKRTRWTRATARAPYPVDLSPKELTTGTVPLTHLLYRVVYQMRWYKGDGTTIDGTATHWATWYRLSSSTTKVTVEGGCYPSVLFGSGAGSAGFSAFNGELAHSGKRGPHWILDNPGPAPELPAVTCRYNVASTLVGVDVRRPMVLARDTGAGIQAQDVAWRVLVQSTPTNSGTESWTTVKQSGWARTRATETSWARFAPISLSLPAMTDLAIRVVYQIRWYRGTSSTIVGRAAHAPLTYARAFPSASDTESMYCLVQEA